MKKAISLGVAAAMAATLLAGCGNQTDNNSSNNDNGGDASDTPAASVSGTVSTDARLEVRATAVGAHTQLAQMAALTEDAQARKSQVQRLVDRIIGWFVPTIIGIVILNFFLLRLTPGDAADVLVVGSLNMDLRIRTPRLPAPGETLTGSGFDTDGGGKGANQAVAAARQGARVAMLGAVGQDAHGAALLAALQADGIDTHAVERIAGTPSGTAAILLMPDGENSIVVIPGANHALTPERVRAQAARLRQARVVVAQLECPLDAVTEALAIAREAGAVTVLNAAPVQPLGDALLGQLDWLVVNEIEAAALAGMPVPGPAEARAVAEQLRRRGPRRHRPVRRAGARRHHARGTPGRSGHRAGRSRPRSR